MKGRTKTLLLALAALMLSGCFLNDLCGTGGDDDRPMAKVYKAPEPNPPVVNGR